MRKSIAILLTLISVTVALQAAGQNGDHIYEDDFHYWVEGEHPDEEGLLIGRIIPDSPAEEAGLMRGDILLAIDENAIVNYREIREILSGYEAGDQVMITLLRGGEEIEISLNLETRLYHPAIGVEFALPFHPRREMAEMMDRFERFEEHRGIEHQGALIIEVLENSGAEKAGLKDGEIILTVDGESVTDDAPLTALIDEKAAGDSVSLEVLDPAGGERTVSAVLDKGEDETAQLGVRVLPLYEFLERFRSRRRP